MPIPYQTIGFEKMPKCPSKEIANFLKQLEVQFYGQSIFIQIESKTETVNDILKKFKNEIINKSINDSSIQSKYFLKILY